MTACETARLALTCGALCGVASSAVAESASDYAVRVSARVQTNPPSIMLSWPGDASATGYTLYRKLRDDTSWGTARALAVNATNYVDTNVVVGGAYEYRISKSASTYYGEGYLYAGIEVPLVESRGKVVLLVDDTQSASLLNELTRLQRDLAGDGWMVLRHDVARMAVDPTNTSSGVWAARSNELANVKALIATNYNADPAGVKAVFVFGHIPVPYTGNLAPDGHIEHVGAWPADGFYGSMNQPWTDWEVDDPLASSPRNRNVPGDGKLDPDYWPYAALALEVGRVDLANLRAFPQSEAELLRRYLNKDHNFRQKLITAERRGLIDDHLGLSTGEPLAAGGWRNFAAFFGASNSFASSDWFGTLSTNSYLWGYGCGAGTYTSCGGVGSTTNFAASDPQVMFTMFFGSYFGDWDSQNNFLRAALGTPTFTLTSVWAGRPHWICHHMALGETIGFSTRLTQNNTDNYDFNNYAGSVHIGLMGDPTLRMHIVAPPSGLLVATNGFGGVDLSWNASPDSVLGYHVYRGPTAAGPFVRVNSGLVNATNYTDPVSTKCTYMVRAVKLEVGGSGSYYNASQGIFQEIAPPAAPQMLVITARSASKVYGEPLPALIAFYSGFVNGDTTNSLTPQAVLSTLATADSPTGNYPIYVSGAAGTNYTISFVEGTLSVRPATTTSLLTSSANPSLTNEPVTFTFTIDVVPPGAGTPSGTVQFKTNGSNAGAPVPLSGGTASYTNSTLEHGWHWVEAEYAGDGNFSATTGFLSDGQLVNASPVAVPDTIERDPVTGVKVSIARLLSNDTDLEGDPISFGDVSATSTNGGTLASDADWITYTPAPGFTNADTFTYTIFDSWGAPATGVATVNIRTNNGLSPNLKISDRGNGWYSIRGSGIPDRTYSIQSADAAKSTNWQTLGPALADPYGIFQFNDTNGSPQRFYRSVYP